MLKLIQNLKYAGNGLKAMPLSRNESGKTDIAISVSDGEIRERLRLSDNLSEQGAEDVLILSKFCNAVLDGFDGFFFHSSCLELDGEGYVFRQSAERASLPTRLCGEDILATG